MAWYRTGTVTVTNGSKVVAGSGTAWAANVQPGDEFSLAPNTPSYEVDFVGADGSLNLVEDYAGSTASGQAYRVKPTQGRVRDLTAAVLQLIEDMGGIEAALTVLSGNVGIGTSTPTDKLTVAVSMALQVNGTTDVVKAFSGGAGVAYFGSTTAGTAFGLLAGGGERVRINNNGAVGIGTTSPGTRFDVALPAGAGTPRVRIDQTGDNPWIDWQRWSGSGSTYDGNRLRAVGGSLVFERSTAAAALGSQTWAESARFDGSGNLGIGTTAPVDKLHVAGAGRFSSGSNAIGLGADGGGSYVEAASGAAVLSLKTSGVARMQLDANGNAGMGGATPKAWNAAFSAIDHRVYQALFSASSGVTGLAANAYYDSVGWKAKSANYAVLYQQDVASGAHIWSGTAAAAAGSGSDPGFAEYARIDRLGNTITTLTSAAPTLTATGQMVAHRVSNTTVRISMRGSDGVTRSHDLAFA